MASIIDQTRVDVALGNRILANEGILDAFGHVSIRNPTNPNRYFLSRSRRRSWWSRAMCWNTTSIRDPVKPTKERLYAERVIHGEIYKARPDVTAVVHHHAPAVMPFVDRRRGAAAGDASWCGDRPEGPVLGSV